jgi:hypothetical protein
VEIPVELSVRTVKIIGHVHVFVNTSTVHVGAGGHGGHGGHGHGEQHELELELEPNLETNLRATFLPPFLAFVIVNAGAPLLEMDNRLIYYYFVLFSLISLITLLKTTYKY